MGRRGPKPQATAVLEAKGSIARSPGRYADRAKDIPPDNDLPDMPDYLNDVAREKWSELCVDLSTMGVMTSQNRELMTSYCTAYAGWRRCLDIVEKVGDVIVKKDKRGDTYIQRNQATVELHKYRSQMDRLLGEMGLTPSSRSQLTSFQHHAKPNDPVADILGRLTSNG